MSKQYNFLAKKKFWWTPQPYQAPLEECGVYIKKKKQKKSTCDHMNFSKETPISMCTTKVAPNNHGSTCQLLIMGPTPHPLEPHTYNTTILFLILIRLINTNLDDVASLIWRVVSEMMFPRRRHQSAVMNSPKFSIFWA